jgi:AmmeMemoRadiSam system protein A
VTADSKQKRDGRDNNMDLYVQLARKTVETYIRDRKIYEPQPEELTEEMKNGRAGAFVSIHENGDLRGCIGTIAPVQKALYLEIIANAISASTRDPRFPPITKNELPDLEISVDVLGEAEEIPSEDYLDVKRYGVIVSKGRRRGLLLPDLEGVDNVETQVAIAKMKAGIREEDTDVVLQRFEVIRHEER